MVAHYRHPDGDLDRHEHLQLIARFRRTHGPSAFSEVVRRFGGPDGNSRLSWLALRLLRAESRAWVRETLQAGDEATRLERKMSLPELRVHGRASTLAQLKSAAR